MKKIKYLLFLIPFLFSFNVFATNVTSSVRCSYNDSGSTYYGDPNDGFNSARCYDFGTRYSPRLGYIEFYLPTSVMSFSAGKSYTVTMNMATNDWRNNIMLQNVRYVNSSGTVITSTSNLPSISNYRFISKKQIKFDFKLPSGTIYPYLRFVLSSPTYGNPDPDISSSTYMTGYSNWNLTSIDISPVSSSSGSSSGSGSSSSSFDDSGIISNNNQNTTDVINNNNQNTQEVIDNQNTNTEKINDTLNSGLNNKCSNLFNPDNVSTCRFGNGNDTLEGCSATITDKNSKEGYVQYSTSSNWQGFHTDYIPVNANTTYYLSFINNNYSNGVNVCIKTNIYRSNKTLISQDQYCTSSNNVSRSVSTPYNGSYVRISMEASVPVSWNTYAKISFNTSNNYCVYGSTTSKLDDTNKGINDIKDNLIDETVPDIDLDLNLDTSSPVSDLLTMPITLLNKVFDTSSDTCQPYVLPFDFSGGNNTLTFPCIDLKHYLGNSVYNILDTILCFFFCYEIGMMCVSIYEDITSLRDGFDSLYTPKHAKPLGKHTREVE